MFKEKYIDACVAIILLILFILLILCATPKKETQKIQKYEEYIHLLETYNNITTNLLDESITYIVETGLSFDNIITEFSSYSEFCQVRDSVNLFKRKKYHP